MEDFLRQNCSYFPISMFQYREITRRFKNLRI